LTDSSSYENKLGVGLIKFSSILLCICHCRIGDDLQVVAL